MESTISVFKNKLVLVENFGKFDLADLMEVAEQALETCSRLCIDKILIDSRCLEKKAMGTSAHFTQYVSPDSAPPAREGTRHSLEIAVLTSKASRHMQEPFADIMNLTGITTIFLDSPLEVRSWLQAAGARSHAA